MVGPLRKRRPFIARVRQNRSHRRFINKVGVYHYSTTPRTPVWYRSMKVVNLDRFSLRLLTVDKSVLECW